MRKEEREKEQHSRLADDKGAPSLGRWMVYYGTIMSGLLVVVGVLISIFEVAFQPYILPSGIEALVFHSNIGIPMIATGVGIYTSGAIAKSWQAHAEAQKMSVDTNCDLSGEQNATGQTGQDA